MPPSQRPMDKPVSGGCACGAVRYQLTAEPWDIGWCHCRICRVVSGAPALVFASVAACEFAYATGGEKVRSFASTSFGRREFCGECGTPLTMRVDHQPETVDFTVATLDDPDAVAPGFHIFYASKVSWFETADALPRHAKFRPETRGLANSEPRSDF